MRCSQASNPLVNSLIELQLFNTAYNILTRWSNVPNRLQYLSAWFCLEIWSTWALGIKDRTCEKIGCPVKNILLLMRLSFWCCNSKLTSWEDLNRSSLNFYLAFYRTVVIQIRELILFELRFLNCRRNDLCMLCKIISWSIFAILLDGLSYTLYLHLSYM